MTKLVTIAVPPRDLNQYNLMTGKRESFTCTEYAVRVWAGEEPPSAFAPIRLADDLFVAASPIYPQS